MSLADVTMDARILRQVEFLTGSYDVVVAAPGEPLQAPRVEFVQLPSRGTSRGRRLQRIGLRLAGRYARAYWLEDEVCARRETLRAAGPVSAIIVNDLLALPLALDVADGAAVIFDAHEHWTSESASWGPVQRLSMRGAHEWVVDHAVRHSAAMMTVSPGIAREYEKRAGVRPTLVTNAPFQRDLEPSPVDDPIRLLHVGIADERRRLEDTIEAVRSLGDRFSLDLVLVRENEYRRRLEALARSDGRIRILPPVPTAELVAFANAYDVGVFLLPARFPNQTHVLPNKLFDYIQARLAIAIGPSPEMAAIVREWDCGVVSDTFEVDAFAAALSTLTKADVERMKASAARAAAVLNADNNREIVLDLVRAAVESRIGVTS
jgi:glycosyltransferase involved in cell wall biosynthesis